MKEAQTNCCPSFYLHTISSAEKVYFERLKCIEVYEELLVVTKENVPCKLMPVPENKMF